MTWYTGTRTHISRRICMHLADVWTKDQTNLSVDSTWIVLHTHTHTFGVCVCVCARAKAPIRRCVRWQVEVLVTVGFCTIDKHQAAIYIEQKVLCFCSASITFGSKFIRRFLIKFYRKLCQQSFQHTNQIYIYIYSVGQLGCLCKDFGVSAPIGGQNWKSWLLWSDT